MPNACEVALTADPRLVWWNWRWRSVAVVMKAIPKLPPTASKQPESKYQEKHTRDGEVAARQSEK